MILDSWGRYPQSVSTLLEPLDAQAAQRLLLAHGKEESLIARGAGRSYGDSALAPVVLSSRFLDSFTSFDSDSGIIHCGAGVSLDSILKISIPQGWFLPVIPGTKFVSVGGAIAADVHGKNHHVVGSFCAHVTQLHLMLASGELLHCSLEENPEIFHASCAGMGLTGIIIDAKIQLVKIPGTNVDRVSKITENLDATLDALEKYNDSTYSVAWLDCLASKDKLGRSVLFLGEHRDEKKFDYKESKRINVPFSSPSFFLNKYSMTAFNSTYFNLQNRKSSHSTVNYNSFFFPLDSIGKWNRLYGRQGFLQYQFVVPTIEAATAIRKVLEKVSASGKGSFLCVLKKFGQANKNLLSFPMEGFTLTLDFKRERSLFPLLAQLDEIVTAHQGRIYLAKDARMSEATFKQGYEQWETFAKLKSEIDPDNKFGSDQSKRLGLS